MEIPPFYCNVALCRSELADLHYQVQKNDTVHLVGFCLVHGYRFLPYVPDLPIPQKLTKRARKIKSGEVFGKLNPQPTLF